MPSWIIWTLIGLTTGLVFMAIFAPKNEGFITKFNIWARKFWAWTVLNTKKLWNKIFRRNKG